MKLYSYQFHMLTQMFLYQILIIKSNFHYIYNNNIS